MNIEKKKRKLRIVVDTNVIISALNFGGNPGELMIRIRGGVVHLYLSRFILDEVYGVLVTKFQWEKSYVEYAVKLLQDLGTTILPRERIAAVYDEADNRILECARACHADYLISGDRDLLRLKNYSGTQIITVKQFLDILYS